MRITYCSGWFRANKRYTELWDESRARKAHEKRKLYTALIGDPEHPDCFIESNMSCFNVGFLDDLLREHLMYQFQEIDSGRVFLTMMITREFDQDWDFVQSGTSYLIEPDGQVIRRYQEFPTTEQPTHEPLGKIDPSPYWEPYPQFGHYEGLIRKRPVPMV